VTILLRVQACCTQYWDQGADVMEWHSFPWESLVSVLRSFEWFPWLALGEHPVIKVLHQSLLWSCGIWLMHLVNPHSLGKLLYCFICVGVYIKSLLACIVCLVWILPSSLTALVFVLGSFFTVCLKSCCVCHHPWYPFGSCHWLWICRNCRITGKCIICYFHIAMNLWGWFSLFACHPLFLCICLLAAFLKNCR